MSKTKIDCEQAVCLSQELFHAHFAGEPEKWFSYLSPDSILSGHRGTGVIRQRRIRARFKDFSGILLDILTEEYHPVPLDSSSAWSAARSWSRTSEDFCVITASLWFTGTPEAGSSCPISTIPMSMCPLGKPPP